MRELKNKLTTSGKSSTNIQSRRGKSFGYQVLGFGAGGTVNPFVEATGGTIAIVCTNYKTHTFTGPGSFCVTSGGNSCGSETVDYMVIAGGGGGASLPGPNNAGGAGAGGFRESPGTASGCYTASPRGASPAVALPVSAGAYPITVGAGGTRGTPSGGDETNGADSIFSTITSAGGGLPAGSQGNPTPSDANGGSGGGGMHRSLAGGAGNTPPTNPVQGTAGGGNCGSDVNYAGAGGGGAGVAGSNVCGPGCSSVGGAGGAGVTTSISATPTAYSGGGGGGGYHVPAGGGGVGGAGGGGAGGPIGTNGTNGTTNLGGGGGGGGNAASHGGTGGSGVVIIRYKFQ